MATTRSRPRRPPETTVVHRETRAYVVPGLTEADYLPAYRYGVLVADRHGKKEFAEVEPLLAEGWLSARGTSRLSWAQARPAVQDGYAGVVRVRPVQAAPAERPAKPRTARRKAVRRPATTRRKATTRRRSGRDNLAHRGPRDRSRINTSEPWEVDYWCERLGVTPAQLRRAVKAAGPMAKDVRRVLRK